MSWAITIPITGWSVAGEMECRFVPNTFPKAFFVVDKIGILSLRFHDLRHTFASLALSKGVPLLTVANARPCLHQYYS